MPPGPASTRERAARPRPCLLAAAVAAGLALAPGGGRADPSFTFEKPKDGGAAAWSGTIRAGACLSGGNTSSAGLSAEGTLARATRRERLLLAGAGAYARSRVAVPAEADGVPGVGPGELRQVDRTTRRNWSARLRYDRFTGARGSAYLLAAAGADEPAGKRLVLGAQAGWGLDLVQRAALTLRLEAGYDLSREDHLPGTPRLEIHSARLLAGLTAAPGGHTTVEGSVELLTNLNAERAAPRTARAFEDTRVNARLSLAVKLNGSLSTGLKLSALYDAAPAPRPPPPGSAWQAGYAPRADRLDTTAEWFVAAKF